MKSLIVLVMAGLWIPGVAHAQGGQAASGASPLVLTLDDAISRGLATSHRIAEATARRDAADAGIEERRVETFGILLPDNQLRVIYPDIPDNYRSRLDVQWPIYTGGRVDATIEAARA